MDKRESLSDILEKTNRQIHEIAYIGDDVNDVGIMEVIALSGLTACPGDAMPAAKRVAHYAAKAPGGNGAFRDFAEWIMKYRNK